MRCNITAATLSFQCAELEKQAINLSQKGGYRVLVPDLYKGKLGADKEEAHHVGALSPPLALLLESFPEEPASCAPQSRTSRIIHLWLLTTCHLRS